MSRFVEHDGQVAFHPGYYINEFMEDADRTPEEFASLLGTDPDEIMMLVDGKMSLSPELAIKLSSLLGTSVEFWLNLQSSYDEKIAAFAV